MNSGINRKHIVVKQEVVEIASIRIVFILLRSPLTLRDSANGWEETGKTVNNKQSRQVTREIFMPREIKHTATLYCKSGKYYVGDPCNILNEQFCERFILENSMMNDVFCPSELDDEAQTLVGSNASIPLATILVQDDGLYPALLCGVRCQPLPVDSAMLAVIPGEFANNEDLPEAIQSKKVIEIDTCEIEVCLVYGNTGLRYFTVQWDNNILRVDTDEEENGETSSGSSILK